MWLGLFLGACALAALGSSGSSTSRRHARPIPQSRPRAILAALPKPELSNTLSHSLWAFEPNVGQTDARVKFMARANDASVFLTQRGVVLSWTGNAASSSFRKASHDALRLDFLGASDAARVSGRSLLRGKTNYLLGRDPRKWLRDVPRYASVEYRELYPGIDARFYGGNSGLEYDLLLSPGSSLRNVRLRIVGADAIRLDRGGNLHFHASKARANARQIVMRRPKIYQMDGGRRISVDGGYKLLAGNAAGFVIGKHRADLPIVIDPSISISYTTFLGGSGAERGSSVAVDSTGAIYVGGTTTLAAFPETAKGSEGPLAGSSNLFVAKIDPTQTGAASLVYLTFIGGSQSDQGGMVAVDPSAVPPGLAVLGWTTSADFPVTNGSALNGASDLTVTKLNGAGDGMVFSKYFGGSGAEATQSVAGIASDSAGNVFVTSDTASTDLPMTATPNGFRTVYGGGASDGFLAEFASGSGALLYSTYLGINATVGSSAVALDASANAYVAGFTTSPANFPAVNALQPYGGGAFDGFVMQINPKLGAHGLVYASLLGGSQSDQAAAIAVDASIPATAYITGTTHSPDFIPASGVANAAYQTALKGSSNAFLAVISQTGGLPSIQYETYLGGTGADAGAGVAVVSPAQVYVAGSSTSADFPALCSLQGFSGAQDAFLAELNPTTGGNPSLLDTTFLGGSVTAEANAVAADSAGNAIVFGDTMSHDYPLAANANNGFQPTCTSCAATSPFADAMLTKVAAGTAPAACAAFNPAIVNLGALPTGTPSPPIDISLANGGDANLNVSGVTITGANSADFSQMNTCLSSSPIAPGANCGIAVTFTPSVVGTETAALQITDDGVGTPQTLRLTGAGASGEVTLSQSSLSFGNVAQGTTTAPGTSILTNTGNATLSITNAKIAGSNATDFAFGGSNTCSAGAATLPGASCTISVDFAPNEPNPPQNLTARVEISFLDTGNQATGTAAIALSGTEATAPAPAVSLASTALDFGSVNVGGSTSQPPVLLKNTGSAALSITSIGITGSNAGDFTQTSTCPLVSNGTLAPGASCTISVTFRPTAGGARAASVVISDNANPAQQTIALSGTGATASVSLTPTSLTFATQNEGPPSAAQNATLKNTGASPVTISSISFAGANATDFAETNNCPLAPSATLNAGGICTIAVTFQPIESGPLSAVLSVADDSSPSPQTVTVSGTGTIPVVQATPTALQFSSTVVGVASASQSIQVSNTGTGALVISGVSFAGADGGDFEASGSCVGAKGASVSVAAGGNCTLDVEFLPLAAGTRTATLALNDNANASPPVTFAGTATDFQLSAAPGGTTSATVTAGQTAVIALQVSGVNGFTGTLALGCTNAPPAGGCSVSPSSAQISNATPVPFTVNVTTTARGLILPITSPGAHRRTLPATPMAITLMLALAALFFAAPRGRKSRLLRPILVLSLLLLASCGGSGSSTTAPSGTPPGTYTVQA
ncbi:MAG TPA: choice-of-anchor D domain-containing protein, partial [Candidatus Acidoferrales bacterium]|nr:choice-of-anchor D domain-containing protein [Candidatus Acidoferrales bacterium]